MKIVIARIFFAVVALSYSTLIFAAQTIEVVGMMGTVNDLTIVEAAPAALDLSQANTNVVQGTVRIQSSGLSGFKLTVTSTNGGFKHLTLPTAPLVSYDYSLLANSGSLAAGLSAPTIVNLVPETSGQELSYTGTASGFTDITYSLGVSNAASNAAPGSYEDVLTIALSNI